MINHGLNFVERRIPKDEHFVQQYSMLERYSGGGDLSAPAIVACGRLPTRLHRAYLEEYGCTEIVIHDGPFTVDYDFFAGTDSKPRVYNAYNSEAVLYRQLHPNDKSQPIHELVRTAEQRMLHNADVVLYCSEGDLSAFKDLAPDAGFDALYVPNGVNPLAEVEYTSVNASSEWRVVFMGSGHPPNAVAADFIVKTLAPALPGISFDIIGNCLPEGRYPANVKRHGVVDDAMKQQILRRANLALNPMAAGSGSNVKVLEYFAFGLPVLSTDFGMRGIQAKAGQDYLVAPLDEFATPGAREYFTRKKEASIGPFAENLVQSEALIAEANLHLERLAPLIVSEQAVGGTLGEDDLHLFATLRSHSIVKGLVYPPVVEAYRQRMTKRAAIMLHDEMAS